MRVKEKIKADDNRQKAFDYLRNKGYQDHEIAGILGNFAIESGSKDLKVDAYNPNDVGKPAFGLAQWRADRLDRLKEQQGKNMYTLEGQLDYLTWELENTEKSARKELAKAKTPEEAALIFSRKFERPRESTAKNDVRQQYAKAFYTSYSNIDDKDLVYVKEDGAIKTKDRQYATTMELYDSDKIAKELSSKAFNIVSDNLDSQYLTNLQDTNNNVTFEEEKTQEEPKQEEQIENPWKAQLKEKIQKRNNLLNLISSEGFDLQFIEQDRKTMADTQPTSNQNVMRDGGQVKVSSRGLLDYPGENVLVPTQDGRITMKDISYPVKGISQETGEEILMQPGGEYQFKNTKNVLELPQLQNGGEIKSNDDLYYSDKNRPLKYLSEKQWVHDWVDDESTRKRLSNNLKNINASKRPLASSKEFFIFTDPEEFYDEKSNEVTDNGLKRLKNARTFTPSSWEKEDFIIENLTKLNIGNEDRLEELKYKASDGVYDIPNNTVFIEAGDKKDTATHEYSHVTRMGTTQAPLIKRSNDIPQKVLKDLSSKLGGNYIIRRKPFGGGYKVLNSNTKEEVSRRDVISNTGVDVENFNYIYSPEEVYSRIMTIRKKSGIKPGENFTKEKLKKVKNNLSDDIFRYYSDEELLHYLNTLADTSKSKKNNTRTA